MAESVGSIFYTVDAQTQGLLQAERQVDRSTRRMEQGFDRADGSVNKLNGSLGQLRTIVTAVAGAMAVQRVVQYADAWTAVTNKLKIASETQREYNDSVERTFAIAKESRNSFEGTVDLYTKLARTNRTLKRSQEEVYQVTETVAKAVALSGVSAQAAEGAVTQFGQAMSNNFSAAGEEVNSILENTPGLAEAIARGLGTTADQIKIMGQEGELSAEKVFNALLRVGDYVDNQFANTQRTFSQNWQDASDNMMRFVGESDAVTTIVRESGDAIVVLSKNIDTVAQVAAMAASVVGGRLLQSIQATTTEYVKKAAANLADAKAEATAAQQVVRRTAAERTAAMALLASAKTEEQATRGTSAHAFALQQLSAARVRATEAAGAHTAATNAATAAMGRATVAARGMAAASRMAKGALALIGGPMGVAVIAATGLAMYHDELDEMLAPSRRAEQAVDDLTESIDRNSRAALENGIAKYKAQLADLETQAEDARAEIDKINDENNTPGPFRQSMVMGPGADERRAEYKKLDELGVQIQARKDGIESLQESLEKLGDAGGGGSGDGNGDGGGGGESSDAVKKARKRFEALKKQLETERETIEREYRERNALIRRFTEEGSQEQVRLLEQSSKKRREALKGISEEYQGLIDELYPVRAAQRQFREEMERLELARQIGLIDDLSDAQKRLRESMRSDESWQDAYGFSPDDTKQLDKTNDAARELGMTFTSAFEDAIVEGEGFREVLQGIAEDIQRLMLRKSITEPATDALSGALDGFDWGGLFSFGGGGSYGGSGWAGSVVTAASGGYVSGPGTSTSDSIPARLSDGEFVVNAQATSRPGVRPMLEALNSNRAYAKGGFVGGGSSGSGGLGGVVVNVHTDSGSQVTRQESQGQGGTRQIDLYIERKVRSTVHGMFSSGEMDRPMRRFGARRQSTG